MSESKRKIYQKALQSKLAELSRGLQRREDIAIEKFSDTMDEVQLASERDFTIRSMDRDSILLWEIRASLDRILDGSYGTCLRCDEAIPAKRLEAVPWAQYCITCQEVLDRHNLNEEAAEAEAVLAA